jgi:hypothetical protein
LQEPCNHFQGVDLSKLPPFDVPPPPMIKPDPSPPPAPPKQPERTIRNKVFVKRELYEQMILENGKKVNAKRSSFEDIDSDTASFDEDIKPDVETLNKNMLNPVLDDSQVKLVIPMSLSALSHFTNSSAFKHIIEAANHSQPKGMKRVENLVYVERCDSKPRRGL